MLNNFYPTVRDAAQALERGEVSSEELTRAALDRCEQANPRMNCFISLCREPAMASAQAADATRRAGRAGPLTGIPMAHKDVFCTRGIRTTCGSRYLDQFIPPYDATVVRRLADAGMVMIGKTGMDEFAMGSSTENNYYGPVPNPWHNERVPGGSSGASAACVAAGLVAAATGSDTGGSIRQPAAFCGITGLKPTYGRVSRYGMIAFASSLEQAGPMTRTAADAALLLGAMAGHDPCDATTVDKEVPDYTAALEQTVRGRRIGFPAKQVADADEAIAASVQQALNTLTDAGAEVIEVDLPSLTLSVPAYYVIAAAECSSNLSRYDGVRYGHRCRDATDIADLYERSRNEGLGSEVKRRLLIGAHVLSAGYHEAYYMRALRVRRLILNDFVRVLGDVDVIAMPTTPTAAFKLNEHSHDPVAMYLSDLYTAPANLAGLPAVSFMTGLVNGLPAGMQLIGGHFEEATILNVAHQFQQLTDWHKRTPPDASSPIAHSAPA